jgi:hypothetical protein
VTSLEVEGRNCYKKEIISFFGGMRANFGEEAREHVSKGGKQEGFTIIYLLVYSIIHRRVFSFFQFFVPVLFGITGVDTLCAPVRTYIVLAHIIRCNPCDLFQSFACFLL